MSTTEIAGLGSPEAESEPLPDDVQRKIAGKSPTKIALERLRHDKVALVSGGIVLLLILAGVCAPIITRLWGISQNPSNLVLVINPQTGLPSIGPPDNGFIWSHPLGIDPTLGSDNLAYLLYGLRTSLAISLFATVFSTIVGLVLGLMAGFIGGWVDRVITFLVDTFLAFPFLLGALSLAPIITNRFASNQSALGLASFLALAFVLVFFGWMTLTRLIRGQVFQLREREFVQAAQVIGVPTRRILFRELLPNLLAPIVVFVSLSLPAFVAAEAGLSYLGIGLTNVASLGQMIQRSIPYYSTYPEFLFPPVIVLAILVLGLNLFGDSVRDAFDPGTRR